MNVDDVDNCTNFVGSSSSPPDQPLLLCDHVRLAVSDYVTRLDGEEITNLYGIVINEVERPLIKTVLELCGHNQSKAAQMLGLSRSTLRKKMASYGTL
jgi:Fis family transcriptional regulator